MLTTFEEKYSVCLFPTRYSFANLFGTMLGTLSVRNDWKSSAQNECNARIKKHEKNEASECKQFKESIYLLHKTKTKEKMASFVYVKLDNSDCFCIAGGAYLSIFFLLPCRGSVND